MSDALFGGIYSDVEILEENQLGTVGLVAKEAGGEKFLAVHLSESASQSEHLDGLQEWTQAMAAETSGVIAAIGESHKLDDGTVVLEWEGRIESSLQAVFATKKGLPLSEVLPLGASLVQAIAGLESAHLSLSPSVIDRTGTSVRVFGAGLSRLLPAYNPREKNTAYFGSPEFMAPELCSGKGASDTSDQYSIGLMMYALVTGKSPFKSSRPATTLKRQMYEKPLPLKLVKPGMAGVKEFEAVLQQSLEKDPTKRYGSSTAFLSAIADLNESLFPGSVVASPAEDAESAAEPSSSPVESSEDREPSTDGESGAVDESEVMVIRAEEASGLGVLVESGALSGTSLIRLEGSDDVITVDAYLHAQNQEEDASEEEFESAEGEDEDSTDAAEDEESTDDGVADDEAEIAAPGDEDSLSDDAEDGVSDEENAEEDGDTESDDGESSEDNAEEDGVDDQDGEAFDPEDESASDESEAEEDDLWFSDEDDLDEFTPPQSSKTGLFAGIGIALVVIVAAVVMNSGDEDVQAPAVDAVAVKKAEPIVLDYESEEKEEAEVEEEAVPEAKPSQACIEAQIELAKQCCGEAKAEWKGGGCDVTPGSPAFDIFGNCMATKSADLEACKPPTEDVVAEETEKPASDAADRQLQLAKEALDRGDLDAAEELYKGVLTEDASNEAAKSGLAAVPTLREAKAKADAEAKAKAEEEQKRAEAEAKAEAERQRVAEEKARKKAEATANKKKAEAKQKAAAAKKKAKKATKKKEKKPAPKPVKKEDKPGMDKVDKAAKAKSLMKKGVGALKAKNNKLALKYFQKAKSLDPSSKLIDKYIKKAQAQ